MCIIKYKQICTCLTSKDKALVLSPERPQLLSPIYREILQPRPHHLNQEDIFIPLFASWVLLKISSQIQSLLGKMSSPWPSCIIMLLISCVKDLLSHLQAVPQSFEKHQLDLTNSRSLKILHFFYRSCPLPRHFLFAFYLKCSLAFAKKEIPFIPLLFNSTILLKYSFYVISHWCG